MFYVIYVIHWNIISIIIHIFHPVIAAWSQLNLNKNKLEFNRYNNKARIFNHRNTCIDFLLEIVLTFCNRA